MRWLFILILALAVSGCGGSNSNSPDNTSLQSDQGTVNNPTDVLNEIGQSAKYVYVDTYNQTGCYGTTMEIAKPNWDNFADHQRRMLVYNAFGRCVLGRSYKNDMLPSGAPASLMNQYVVTLLDEPTFLANKEYYLQELFNNK